MQLTQLTQLLTSTPQLQAALDLDRTIMYIDLARLARGNIRRIQAPYEVYAPQSLPLNVHEFLMVCTGMDYEVAKVAWETLRGVIWDSSIQKPDVLRRASTYTHLIMEHGLRRGIGFYNLYPPHEVCLDPSCRQSLHPLADSDSLLDRELKEPSKYEISAFTLQYGAVPGFTTSLYCRNCHTRYHSNYYIHSNATIRTYYPSDTIELIEASDHIYMTRDVCEMFANAKVTTWASATNCARLYNTSIAYNQFMNYIPMFGSRRSDLQVNDVWNGFFLHSLLLDCSEQANILELPHNASSQAERLRPALEARNERMVGPGQEHWNHACDLCTWIYVDDEGVQRCLRSTVTDGVTIGHPCCGEHDCPIPLDSVKHRFCPEHQYRDNQCAVTKCTAPVEQGWRTCTDKEHRKLEDYHVQQGKAMFQLKRRLERARSSQTHNSLALPESTLQNLQDADSADGEMATIEEGSGIGGDQETEVDANGICDGKPETGNRPVRARFGRKRTHNEELCVASCGILLGRATFFGSEAPNGVRTFWMKLFPTKASLPGVLWHDNNCRIRAMLETDTDPFFRHYFDDCAMPVDVFHFKCKHKERDIDCGRYCNPYIWPELRTEDGKWRFNSSAAEQANAWFGGFQAIVREMRVERYNFFLDEMIKRRNRMLVKELERKGHGPYSIPRDALLNPNEMETSFEVGVDNMSTE